MRQTHITPRFVEFIPDHLEDGVIYISERFRTCSHNCCCGCGEEVVLPLSPAEWQLSRDDDAVSLWPSVGNWDYACKSHYVIRWNRVRWAGSMTAQQIKRVKQRDEVALRSLVGSTNAARERDRLTVVATNSNSQANAVAPPSLEAKESVQQPSGTWRRLLSLFGICRGR